MVAFKTLFIVFKLSFQPPIFIPARSVFGGEAEESLNPSTTLPPEADRRDNN